MRSAVGEGLSQRSAGCGRAPARQHTITPARHSTPAQQECGWDQEARRTFRGCGGELLPPSKLLLDEAIDVVKEPIF